MANETTRHLGLHYFISGRYERWRMTKAHIFYKLLENRVSSRLPIRKAKESKEERKIAATRLREYNKTKQMSSLGAAIIFFTPETFGWTRTLAEVCDCFCPSLGHPTEPMRIKGKHCSRAMNAIKLYFPEYARMLMPGSNPAGKDFRSSQIYDSEPTSNSVDHFVRTLQLPHVAKASIRTLQTTHRQTVKDHSSEFNKSVAEWSKIRTPSMFPIDPHQFHP